MDRTISHEGRMLFHTAHYNIIAKEIREKYSTHGSCNMQPYKFANRTLEELAVSFAERFKLDNPRFNPIEFLDACSPDPDIFPFSELWEEDE